MHADKVSVKSLAQRSTRKHCMSLLNIKVMLMCRTVAYWDVFRLMMKITIVQIPINPNPIAQYAWPIMLQNVASPNEPKKTALRTMRRLFGDFSTFWSCSIVIVIIASSAIALPLAASARWKKCTYRQIQTLQMRFYSDALCKKTVCDYSRQSCCKPRDGLENLTRIHGGAIETKKIF